MQLCDLPDDILRLVLRESLDDGFTGVDRLKGNLPLLAVCRAWRCLAAPVVYREMFIEYNKWRYDMDSHLCGGEPRGELEDPKATTNLDLIVAAGCVDAVREVDIAVNCRVNPLPGLKAAIQTMRAVAEVWERVAVLRPSMFTGIAAFDEYRVDMAEYEDDIRLVGTALTAMLPGIRDAKFYAPDDNPLARALYKQLTDHYANQLCALDSWTPVTVSPGRVLTQLARLDVASCSESGYRLPRIDPANLKTLKLSQWSASCSWAPFGTGDDDAAIKFPSLTLLSMSDDGAPAASDAAIWHQSSFPWKLCFPRLREIRVARTDSVLPLLKHAALPSHMDRICIYATAPALQYVSELSLPATKHLMIGTDDSAGDNADGDDDDDDDADYDEYDVPPSIAAACRIFEHAQGAESLELNIEDSQSPILPEHITCTSITSLYIRPSVGVGTMLGLIGKLPKLASIYISYLNADEAEADLQLPGPDEDCVVEPLSTSIREITIAESSVLGGSPEIIKYLLLKIPSLARLHAAFRPKRRIAEFVDAYSTRYPRLLGVKLVHD